MNIYPALKASMGSWSYYIIKMKMKDLVKEVDFASEIYSSKTLDDAIQRELEQGRAKIQMVRYLAHRTDRFFSSIVVAAIDGNPTFFPVRITDDERFALLRGPAMDDAFGVLRFDGDQKYYALDGQHRLKSIKTLIQQEESGVPAIPDGFHDEEVSVIVLVRQEANQEEFFRSYRRIFSSLNRYAKATDRDTNIIMDEDDWVALLTRRLLVEHDFFLWKGKADSSPKLKTKGKNLKSGDPFFTTLQTLYAMNEKLLMTPRRDHLKMWTEDFKQFNPGEDELDALFEELTMYWDALLAELPILSSDPATMRTHEPQDDNEELDDCILFWPIGQEMLADLVRFLLNRRLTDTDRPTLAEVRECVSKLAKVNWSLHQAPWRGLLLVKDPVKGNWKMRSEERKLAVKTAQEIMRFRLGLLDLPEDAQEELKGEWDSLLQPRPTRDDFEADWSRIAQGVD